MVDKIEELLNHEQSGAGSLAVLLPVLSVLGLEDAKLWEEGATPCRKRRD